MSKAARTVTSLHWTLPAPGQGVHRLAEGGRRTRLSDPGDDAPRPMFSVVTISYNSGVRLQRCLRAAMRQSFRDFEYIVVDGGSTDGSIQTLQALEQELDYFVSEPDGGIYKALNRGLGLSRGRYIVVIHADDFLTLDALEQAASLIAATGCEMALGDSIYIDQEGKPIAYKPARDYGSEAALRGIPGPHEAAFIAAETYERTGPYDWTYAIAADFKLMRNAVRRGARTAAIGRVVNYKELGGESFDKERERAENARLLAEIYPALPEQAATVLYALKNYVNPTAGQLAALTELLRNSGSLPSTLLRDVGLALLSRQRGDGPSTSTSSAWDRWTRHNGTRAAGRRRIVFTILKLKTIAGGAERVLVDMANDLAGRGHEVWVACSDGRVGAPFYDLAAGIRFVDINEMPNNSHFLQPFKDLQQELHDIVEAADPLLLKIAVAPPAMRSSFRDWPSFDASLAVGMPVAEAKAAIRASIPDWARRFAGNVARWRSFLGAVKPDLVVPFMISNIQQMYVACRNTSHRQFLSNHNNSIRDYYNQDEWDATPIDRLLRFQAVRSATRVHWLLDEYVAHMPPACRDNAVVIGNAVQPAKLERRPDLEVPTILAVGRLTAIKNFGLLVRAFALIADRHKVWTVSIFGDGPQRDELQTQIEALGLAGRVRLMGVTDAIDHEYVKAKVFVSASTVEGFPLTLCEAMAHGLPVIGRSACSGVNTLVDPGRTGLLIDCDDPELEADRLAAALDALLTDAPLRQRLGAAARESVKRFAPEAIFGRWAGEIEAAMQAPR